MRALHVCCHGILAGVLKEIPGEGYVFRYFDDYQKDPHLPSISLTLPKTRQEYKSKFLFPFFSNMLSEGHNRRVQARLLHVDEDDEFGILAQTALYDTPGAVTVKPIDL